MRASIQWSLSDIKPVGTRTHNKSVVLDAIDACDAVTDLEGGDPLHGLGQVRHVKAASVPTPDR